jgi:hypothetical protein
VKKLGSLIADIKNEETIFQSINLSQKAKKIRCEKATAE